MAKKKSKKTTARKTTARTTKSTTKASKPRVAAKPTQTTKKSTRKKKTTAAAAKAAKTTKKLTRGKRAAQKADSPSINGAASANRNPTIPAPQNLTVDEATYEGPLTEEQLRAVKTGLSKKDLEYFRELLLEKRAEIVGSVEGMQEARNSGGGDSSHMPLHMADVGSEHFEQEFNLGLMESEKRLVREIDEALMRIQNGTYGVCIQSGRPIPRARLEIKPWAKYTIEVAMQRERRGLR